MNDPKRVLVAIDGSAHAWRALDEAVEYAQQADAHLVVMHVVPFEEAPKELREFAGIENVDPGDVVFRWRTNTMLGDKLMAEASRRLSDTPFLFLSALAYQQAIDKGMSVGADHYLTKPVDFDALLSRIEMCTA